MNMKLMTAIIGCLVIAGSAIASVSGINKNNYTAMKGYITIGRNVVVLPERLQSGDRIDFYNAKGSIVFEQYVGAGYLAADVSNLAKGAYTLTVFREDKIVSTQKVPFIGNKAK